MKRNGRVISSACKDCSTGDKCGRKIICNETWSRFYSSSQHLEENSGHLIKKADINDAFANFYDPFINGMISEQCSPESLMDVRLRDSKKDIGWFSD